MAITDTTIINFCGGTDLVTNEVANNITDATTLGTLIGGGNLVDVNNATTDVSIACNIGQRTAFDGGGIDAGSNLTNQEINRGGIFRQTSSAPIDQFEYVLDFPPGHGPVDISVYLCTSFPNQTLMDIDVVGANTGQVLGWDASGNLTGDFATLSDITPDGSNQITVTVTINDVGNFFVYWNGMVLNPPGGPPGIDSLLPLTGNRAGF